MGLLMTSLPLKTDPTPELPDASAPPAQPLRILVVDDSKAQRRLLTASLRRAGYDIAEAASGDEALAHCLENPVDLILSDWMMPGMNGVEFCQAFRRLGNDNYGYFILLTSKSERADIAAGLDAGADDFLTKPVNRVELTARIKAGARIVQMQRELSGKNRVIARTLEELQGLYESIDNDLLQAKKLQQSLVRDRVRDVGAAHAALLLRSSGHVGGDLVGVYHPNDRELGLFAIDVSGHGVTSALLTAQLAGYLSASSPDQNLALENDPAGGYRARAPEQVVARLNTLMFEDMETDHYFTIALAVIDLETGRVRLTQAGHPHPQVLHRDGSCALVGDGGMPVGLVPFAEYSATEFDLAPGDRLFLCSDGVTECPLKGHEDEVLFDDEGLSDFLTNHRALEGPAMLEALIWALADVSGLEDFPDDVSAVLCEFRGADHQTVRDFKDPA
ncbi:MAG: SpoIIE family protein phosphatase [Mangrovicoccus sp.]|nr:SpoIIE family protein phosphatase [Mangrovicoccus sp.]